VALVLGVVIVVLRGMTAAGAAKAVAASREEMRNVSCIVGFLIRYGWMGEVGDEISEARSSLILCLKI